jgi:hypothetical protein
MPSLLPKDGKALVWVQPGCKPKVPSSKTSISLEGRKVFFKVIDVRGLTGWWPYDAPFLSTFCKWF